MFSHINPETKEFIAKILCDLGKAILTVGLASSFFEKMTLWLRFFFGILGITMLILSVVFIARKKGAH